MNPRKEVEEVKEINEVKEKNSGVAAFFDLDGTLMELPSLERRLFRTLRFRKLIPPKNYFLWLKEAIRLMPSGVNAILHGNKMYLRGVQVSYECGEGDREVSPWHKGGHQAEGQASALPSKRAQRNPRLPVPTFFAQVIERMVWHVKQGHEIILLSGTLEPLARKAARALEDKLRARGIAASIRAIATRLEEIDGSWTGRVLGEAMFGEAKTRAAKRLAAELRLDLERSFAYGDSLNDRWLMEAMGRPAAVNPSNELASMARERGWPIFRWRGKENFTQRRPAPIRTSAVHRETVEKEVPRSAIA